MYRELLIPVDLSERNRSAFAVLPAVAVPGASVELLHVVEQITEDGDPEFTAFYRSLERKAHEKLESWCEELRKQGLSPRARVCVGRRGAEILRRAQQTPCDLIMMASHSITGPEGRLGTLSHQVAMLAACSVLLVRSAAPPGSMTAQAAESRNPST